MVPNDPGGIAWSDWKAAGYDSYETFIESKAGACPPGAGAELRAAFDQVRDHMEPVLAAQLGAMIERDWPMPKPPPYPADDEALFDPCEACDATGHCCHDCWPREDTEHE